MNKIDDRVPALRDSAACAARTRNDE